MFEVLISFLLSFRVYFDIRSSYCNERLPNRRLKPTDRRLWVWLSQCWPRWRSALLIVKPTTVVDWHRRGFRWYWTWKVRHGHAGRPSVAKETRNGRQIARHRETISSTSRRGSSSTSA